MPKDIRIENPVSGRGFTSKNRAKAICWRYGRAVWVQPGTSIRISRRAPRARRRAEGCGQDAMVVMTGAAHEGMAQIADLANLPMIQPARLLGNSGDAKGATSTRS